MIHETWELLQLPPQAATFFYSQLLPMEAITSIKDIFLVTAFWFSSSSMFLYLVDSSIVYVFALIHYPIPHSEINNNLVSFCFIPSVFFSHQLPQKVNISFSFYLSSLFLLRTQIKSPQSFKYHFFLEYQHTTQLILWRQTYSFWML